MRNTKAADEARFRKEADQRKECRSDDMNRTRGIERSVGRHVGYKGSSGAGKGDHSRVADRGNYERQYDRINWRSPQEFCDACGCWTCNCAT